MDLNKLWVFGDSFDYGYELTDENHEYYKKFKTPEGKHYTEHIAHKYNLKIENLSVPGYGSSNILYLLSKGLPHIKEDDYVILHTSDSNRLTGFEPVNGGHSFQLAALSIWYSKSDEEIMNFINTSYLQTFSKFMVDCIDPFHHYFEEFYYQIFFNVLTSIKCKKKFGYTTEEWNKYETINQHTLGEINDNHWSYNGHREFADRIISTWELTDFEFKPHSYNLRFIEYPLELKKKSTIL